MEQSFLYDVIAFGVIHKWRDKIKSEDKLWEDRIQETKNALASVLSDNDKDLIKHFEVAIINRIEYIHDCIDVKLINLCLKMGMQVEKAFGYPKDSLKNI